MPRPACFGIGNFMVAGEDRPQIRIQASGRAIYLRRNEAKVAYLNRRSFVEKENIVRLDVPMYDWRLARVQVPQACRHLLRGEGPALSRPPQPKTRET
eukprot:scaffold224944_cov31-Tisochrysis_lutea.AAC.3